MNTVMAHMKLEIRDVVTHQRTAFSSFDFLNPSSHSFDFDEQLKSRIE